MLSETLFFFSSWILGPLNYNPPLFKPTIITRHSLTISVMRLRYYWTHTIYPCILVGTENMTIVLISPHLGFFTRLPVSEFFASSAVSSISRAFSLIFLKKKKKWLSPVQVHVLWGGHSRNWPLLHEVLQLEPTLTHHGHSPSGIHFSFVSSKSRCNLFHFRRITVCQITLETRLFDF